MQGIEKIKDIIQDTDKNFAPYYDVLPNLIKERNYRTGIEIGVFCGGHAERIINTGLDMLFGIDPYKMYEPGMPRLDSQEDFDMLYDMVVMNRLNKPNYSHLRIDSNSAFNYLKDYKVDFIFIDGLHTYEQLSFDLYNYSDLIKKGGVIACHDYNHGSFPLLTKAIDEFANYYDLKINIGPLHLVWMDL
jgi:hypothetical protein